MIELGKTYPDKSGNSVRIICVDRKGEFNVVGLVGSSVFVYDKNGRFGITTSANDLILHEDYSSFVIDEPVMVRDSDSQNWQAENFAGIRDGKALTWGFGTQWASSGSTSSWNQCRRPTAEELGETL